MKNLYYILKDCSIILYLFTNYYKAHNLFSREIMELPIFSYLSAVGSYSAQTFEFVGHSPLSDSDNSMDAGVQDVLKLKQTSEEDFFTWAGEIRVSLDEEKNNYEEQQSKNDQSAKNTQIAIPFPDQRIGLYEKNQTPYRRDQISSEYSNIKINNQFNGVLTKGPNSFEGPNAHLSKDLDLFDKDSSNQPQDFEAKEQERMKEENRFTKNSPIVGHYQKAKLLMKGGNCNNSDGGRAEIDMYLEKSQMAATGNQVEAPGNGVARKRKLDAAPSWQGGKIARVASGQGNQRE